MTPGTRLPYPGLRAFTRDESDLFFGRDGCIDAMVNRLAATRFLAVLGASGSGKSSLVRTGLLDALDLGLHPWAGSRWVVADLHPGGQPIRNLAAALLATKSTAAEPSDVDLLTDFLYRGPRSLAEWASGGNLEPGCNLLILADQFEELFRYGNYARQEEAEAFVKLLIETADIPNIKTHVVVTMRSEFLGACALMPGLAEKINAGLYLTPRMTRDECRDAIEGPASVMRFTVEPALVNRLLNDLANFAPWEAADQVDQAERLARRADQLPLMQHVLNRLWTRASAEAGIAKSVLRLSDYDGLGGLSGALDAHGAEILSALGESRARNAEPLFRSLVAGSSVAHAVRRPCRLGELVEVTGNRDDVVAIVDAFRAPDCNFVRTSEQSLTDDSVIADISHESLIRQWTPLRHWIENEARDAVAWRRLASAEDRYAKQEGGLLTGLDLSGLVNWWASAKPTAAWAARHGGKFHEVQTFLETSQRVEAERAEAERRRQSRETNRLRWGVAALATALLIAVGFGVKAHRNQLAMDAANSDLKTTNSGLEVEKRHALTAEDEAKRQLKAAVLAKAEAETARGEAVEAKLRAEAMSKKAQVSENAVAQVVDYLRSEEVKGIPGMDLVQMGVNKRIATLLALRDPKALVDNVLDLSPDAKSFGAKDQSNSGPDRKASSSTVDRAIQERIVADSRKSVEAARRKFAQSATPENLANLRTAANPLYDALAKLNRQKEADAIQKELLDGGERLAASQPNPATYRVNWDIVIDYGDRIRAVNRDSARKAFARAVQLAELLPPDNAADLYKRVVSYERLGDQEDLDGKTDVARSWFTKEVDAARKRYALEPGSDKLTSFKLGANRLYDALIKLKRDAEAAALEKELIAEAENLARKSPEVASYRVAWDIYTDQGDRYRYTDRPVARKAYARSVDFAEKLPVDNASDLYSRLFSYERLGDVEFADDKFDQAHQWYTKEIEVARKRYALESSADNLGAFRLGMNRMSDVMDKLKRPADAEPLRKEILDEGERLVRRAPGVASYRVAWDIAANYGDRIKTDDPATARKLFERSRELAGMLPQDNVTDLYRRLVSYERLGNLDLAQGKSEPARVWFTREIDIGRRRFAMEPNADTLASLKIAAGRMFEALTNLKRDREGDALQNELVEDAEKLVQSKPDAAVYRIAWDVLTDQGDRLRATDHAGGRKAFLRALQLAELLPTDNANDLHRRVFCLERLGDLATADGDAEAAREFYLKEVDVVRRRNAVDPTIDSLTSLRLAVNRLHGALVKLKRPTEIEGPRKALLGLTEALIAKTPSDASFSAAVVNYLGAADQALSAGDTAQAQSFLNRVDELNRGITNASPDESYSQYRTLDLLAKTLLNKGNAAEARAAFLRAAATLDRYIAFRTASPPRKSGDDDGTVPGNFGALSFMYELGGNFPKAIDAAQRGLALEPDAAWIEANLAHALLLSGKQQEAVGHYLKIRKSAHGTRTILEDTAEDFRVLRSLGLAHPAMDDILKQMAQP